MNWPAFSLVVTFSLHYASCQIERDLSRSKDRQQLQGSNAYWQSQLSREGVIRYPDQVDYRKNEKNGYRNGNTYRDDLGGGHSTTRRYYVVKEGPKFLSEYKQQNAAQTGLQESDNRHVLPHYGYGAGREYPRGGNPQISNFRQNQHLPILNRDPSGQIHYGEYFLNGQRVPNHPNSNVQTQFGQIDPAGRGEFEPNYDGDTRYVPSYPSRLNQGRQHGMNHNGRFIQPHYPTYPDGAALVEERDNVDIPDQYYPDSQLPTYETDNDYHGSHFQVPPGEGYLPYGQDYFFENRRQHNSKNVENTLPEIPNSQYPPESETFIDTRPESSHRQYFIHAGRDGLQPPKKEVFDSTIENERKIPHSEVIENRTDVNTVQPDKDLKPYNPYQRKEEHREEPEESEESHVIRTTASTTSSSQSEYTDSNKNQETAVKEKLVTVPTVDIKFNMFQPDVSDKEERSEIIPQREHIRNRTSDHDSRIDRHDSRLQHNVQQNLHRHRDTTREKGNSQSVYSKTDDITNYHHGKRRQTNNRDIDGSHHATRKRKGQQSNFKSPSIHQQVRPSLRKEDSASVRQVIGDRAAALDLGISNHNSKTDIHANQNYDHLNKQHLTNNNHQLPNPNLFVDTQDGYTTFERSDEYGSVKDRKQVRRKQDTPHRSFENRREHNSRRKQNNNQRDPVKSVPGIAQRNTCPSVSQCRCCRWSTQQTEQMVRCLQPKYKRVDVQVCVEESNGVCVRTGIQQALEPNGSEIRMCSKVQLKRSCHVCCPNHYPVGNKTTCTGILDGIDKTGLRISISADEGQIEYARLPKNYQPRRRHNVQRNGKDRSKNGARTRHQSRRRTVRRQRGVLG